ncbi:stage II sporulation protein M [Loigolactobacillus binensis]|uniref:Stage II sporulation protein M n=1 Tax=Loigolactobacillus binensis TaxID=2559922 RepID=A0ABW3ECH6_9LACO|nr:stage II sporulation protein M [Loigolactobacillus binensis]
MDNTTALKQWRRRQIRDNFVAAWVVLILVAALVYGLLVWFKPDITPLKQALRASLSGIKSNSTWQTFLQIAWHNERAVGVVFLLALIPVPLLYWLNLVGTAASIGLVLYISGHQTNTGLLILTGLLPHGIFEISCFALALALASQLNYYMRSRTKNWRARRYDWIGQLSWRSFVGPLVRQYLLIIIPGLILAAVIEGFVTPWLLTLVR